MGNSESRQFELDETHRALIQQKLREKTEELKSEVKSFKQKFPEKDVMRTVAAKEDVLILRYSDA